MYEEMRSVDKIIKILLLSPLGMRLPTVNADWKLN